MHKFKNYDDEQNVFTAVIGGKEFKISRVVHAISIEYGEFLQLSGNYILELNRISKEVEETTDPEDGDKIEVSNAKMTEMIEDYSKTQFETTHRVVEMILTKNGYKYNADWWHENSDIKQMEMFITDCINKDAPDPDTIIPKKKES